MGRKLATQRVVLGTNAFNSPVARSDARVPSPGEEKIVLLKPRRPNSDYKQEILVKQSLFVDNSCEPRVARIAA